MQAPDEKYNTYKVWTYLIIIVRGNHGRVVREARTNGSADRICIQNLSPIGKQAQPYTTGNHTPLNLTQLYRTSQVTLLHPFSLEAAQTTGFTSHSKQIL